MYDLVSYCYEPVMDNIFILCARARARARVCVCVRACVRACVCVCVCSSIRMSKHKLCRDDAKL